MSHIKRIAVWSAAFSLLLSPVALPQQVSSESVLRYLEQDLNIQPGLGFKKVRLGYTFNKVSSVWGQPSNVQQFPLFGLTKKWSYNAGSTRIVLVGNNVVESIEVIGDFSSPFQTSEGVRFGTSPHQIIAVYGRPDAAKGLEHLTYNRRGIEFAIENGNLRALRVFPAGRAN